MSSLKYIGAVPVNPTDVDNQINTLAQLNSGMSRGYVNGRAVTLAAPYATKTYVDTQDGLYQPTAYYQNQDLLNIPLSSKGVASGVSSLNSSGQLPTAQVPVLGAGVIKGPFGINTVPSGTTSTGSTPINIAQWNIGNQSVTQEPLVFMSVSVLAQSNARPIIDVRIGTPTTTTYASQTQIALGMGRVYYNDYQTVTVLPGAGLTNVMQDNTQISYPPTQNVVITAWLYDANGHSVSTTGGLIAAASVFLVRVAT